MRCPQGPYWDSATTHVSVTWRRNNSATMVPGEEELRVWVQDGGLWIVYQPRGGTLAPTSALSGQPLWDEGGKGGPCRMDACMAFP